MSYMNDLLRKLDETFEAIPNAATEAEAVRLQREYDRLDREYSKALRSYGGER